MKKRLREEILFSEPGSAEASAARGFALNISPSNCSGFGGARECGQEEKKKAPRRRSRVVAASRVAAHLAPSLDF